MTTLRQDAQIIWESAIQSALPDRAVYRALAHRTFKGRVRLVAIGKAAWQMAQAATQQLAERIECGVVITKYDHSKGPLKNLQIWQAGHPVPDENSFRATQAAIQLVSGLQAEDTVLFLVSGGGSALFEDPLIDPGELSNINRQLLGCGASIREINILRKRLSRVKAGRFAQLCAPAQVYSILLSDVLGDALDTIASGPACPDPSTSQQAFEIIKKYGLELFPKAMECIRQETPKQLSNVETCVTGSVRQLCAAAEKSCEKLGYKPVLLTDCLACEAREAGAFLGAIARSHQKSETSLAFIAGGETVVHLRGKGLGGRNQELVLAAAEGIAGLEETAVFSIGSDGTDGPTDAAGAYADANTKEKLEQKDIDLQKTLAENDSYRALKQVDGLIFTGPTGTNVNDLTVLLVKR